MANEINVRADELNKTNAKISDKHIAVYFAYLLESKRNPNGKEAYRYLYIKDISKKKIGERIGVSQPTIRTAEKKLAELRYIEFDKDPSGNVIVKFPDHMVYSWIPIETLQLLLRLSKFTQCGGDILRFYAALHYLGVKRDKETREITRVPLEFNVKPWVCAFGLSPTYQEYYLKFHLLLYVLKMYGVVDFEIEDRRAKGGKLYRYYKNVIVLPPEELKQFDDAAADVSVEQIGEYTRALAALQMEE